MPFSTDTLRQLLLGTKITQNAGNVPGKWRHTKQYGFYIYNAYMQVLQRTAWTSYDIRYFPRALAWLPATATHAQSRPPSSDSYNSLTFYWLMSVHDCVLWPVQPFWPRGHIDSDAFGVRWSAPPGVDAKLLSSCHPPCVIGVWRQLRKGDRGLNRGKVKASRF